MTDVREVMKVWGEQYDFFLWLAIKKVGAERARDLLHDLIASSSQSLARLYSPGRGASLQTYMKTRFHYLVIDQIRKEAGLRRKKRVSVRAFDPGEEESLSEKSRKSSFPDVDIERFKRCLDELPRLSKDAVQKYLDGWSLKEIGEAHGVKTATVSCQLSDVKNRLRKSYKEKSEDAHGS